MRVIEGERIGREGNLLVGCAAAIFDAGRQRLLLTRRADNGRWCLPGGAMEPGESASECCAREVLEETGLVVRVGQLIGVYSTPHRLIEYADGNRWQLVSLCFEAEVEEGELRLSDETTGYGYFTSAEIDAMDVIESHRERIADAFAPRSAAVVR